MARGCRCPSCLCPWFSHHMQRVACVCNVCATCSVCHSRCDAQATAGAHHLATRASVWASPFSRSSTKRRKTSATSSRPPSLSILSTVRNTLGDARASSSARPYTHVHTTVFLPTQHHTHIYCPTIDYERNGRYTGFPALGIEWQKMENPSLRAALGMKVCACAHALIMAITSLARAHMLLSSYPAPCTCQPCRVCPYTAACVHSRCTNKHITARRQLQHYTHC